MHLSVFVDILDKQLFVLHFIYMYIYTHIHTHIYIYIEGQAERLAVTCR